MLPSMTPSTANEMYLSTTFLSPRGFRTSPCFLRLFARRPEVQELASTPRLLVLLSRVQILAEHLSGPVWYRLCRFTQFATDEMRHYAEAAPMRCVVVHEQFISKFRNFGKTLR